MSNTKSTKCKHQSDYCFKLSRTSYNAFIKKAEHLPDLKNKYVVFVHGQLEAVGLSEIKLVKQMHEKYGNITMYAGKISTKKEVYLIE